MTDNKKASPKASPKKSRAQYTRRTPDSQPALKWADRMRELYEHLHTQRVVATVSADDTIALTAFLDGYKALIEGAADDAPDAEFEFRFKALARQAVDVAQRIESGGIALVGGVA